MCLFQCKSQRSCLRNYRNTKFPGALDRAIAHWHLGISGKSVAIDGNIIAWGFCAIPSSPWGDESLTVWSSTPGSWGSSVNFILQEVIAARRAISCSPRCQCIASAALQGMPDFSPIIDHTCSLSLMKELSSRTKYSITNTITDTNLAYSRERASFRSSVHWGDWFKWHLYRRRQEDCDLPGSIRLIAGHSHPLLRRWTNFLSSSGAHTLDWRQVRDPDLQTSEVVTGPSNSDLCDRGMQSCDMILCSLRCAHRLFLLLSAT